MYKVLFALALDTGLITLDKCIERVPLREGTVLDLTGNLKTFTDVIKPKNFIDHVETIKAFNETPLFENLITDISTAVKVIHARYSEIPNNPRVPNLMPEIHDNKEVYIFIAENIAHMDRLSKTILSDDEEFTDIVKTIGVVGADLKEELCPLMLFVTDLVIHTAAAMVNYQNKGRRIINDDGYYEFIPVSDSRY